MQIGQATDLKRATTDVVAGGARQSRVKIGRADGFFASEKKVDCNCAKGSKFMLFAKVAGSHSTVQVDVPDLQKS